MEKRPRLKLERSTADKLIEIGGWLLISVVWGFTLSNYPNLPETIPTHYNGAGQADGFGGKASILTLPLIASILFVGLTILNRFPHVFNYPTIITQENAFRHYTNSTRMIRYLKFSIVFIFGLITLKTINNANGKENGLGVWFLPLSMALIFIPIIYFMIKSFQTKQ